MTLKNSVELGGYVYIITNKTKTTLYIGVTSLIYERIWEHKKKVYPKSFSARYNLNTLIYYEGFQSIEEAISREKYLKGKSRKFKEDLINSFNPKWVDLHEKTQNFDF